MTTRQGGLEAAWAGWSRALVGTLFPAGLGSTQHFAFGQTTLVADVANADPLVCNAEVFRLGDAMPADSPNFSAAASVSEAYALFLRRVASPDLDDARTKMTAADAASQTALNMPIRQAAAAPGGAAPPPTTYVPAYVLDSGFRAKYSEWQVSSIARRTRDGGVIAFRSTIAAAPPPTSAVSMAAPAARSMSLASAPPVSQPVPPPFFRLLSHDAAGVPHVPHVPMFTAAVPPTALGFATANLAGPATAPPAPATGSGDFALEVAFTGLGTFALNPAGWFSKTAIALFKGQLSAQDQSAFFSEGGVLARCIYQVVLGFEPTVTLQFDDRLAFESARSLLAAPQGPSIGIGPITFEAGAAVSTDDDETQTITIGPTASTLPILLGVVSTDV